MEKNTVLAEIYNLSGQILVGIATEEEIKRVVNLARDNDLLDILRKEFSSMNLILTDKGEIAKVEKRA